MAKGRALADPDFAMARKWYQVGKDFGSVEASERLTNWQIRTGDRRPLRTPAPVGDQQPSVEATKETRWSPTPNAEAKFRVTADWH
jgi:hypothetical protein